MAQLATVQVKLPDQRLAEYLANARLEVKRSDAQLKRANRSLAKLEEELRRLGIGFEYELEVRND